MGKKSNKFKHINSMQQICLEEANKTPASKGWMDTKYCADKVKHIIDKIFAVINYDFQDEILSKKFDKALENGVVKSAHHDDGMKRFGSNKDIDLYELKIYMKSAPRLWPTAAYLNEDGQILYVFNKYFTHKKNGKESRNMDTKLITTKNGVLVQENQVVDCDYSSSFDSYYCEDYETDIMGDISGFAE